MYAAIRVRGSAKVSSGIRKTLELLGLDRVNHLVLVRKEQRGMLYNAKGYITFGEIDGETLTAILEKKGCLSGNKKIDKKFLQEKKFKGFSELAKALLERKATLKELGIKPVFRFGPPRKGYERAGIKKSYSVGGALGYRAADINSLIKRMV